MPYSTVKIMIQELLKLLYHIVCTDFDIICYADHMIMTSCGTMNCTDHNYLTRFWKTDQDVIHEIKRNPSFKHM